MYRLTWRTSDGADRETLWNFFGIAVVAFGFALQSQMPHQQTELADGYLFDHLHLAIEACCSAFDKWHICCQAHLIDMPSSVQIVQRIENKIESLKPVDVELRIFDVGMVGLKLDMRIESGCALFSDLFHL